MACYAAAVFSLIPDALIATAIFCGLVARWTYYEYPTLVLLGTAGVVIVLLRTICVVRKYRVDFSIGLMHFWTGWALCVLSFLDNAEISNTSSLEDVTALCLISSVVGYVLVETFTKMCIRHSYVAVNREWWEILGALLACAMIGGHQAWQRVLLVIALGAIVGALKKRTLSAVFLLVYFLVSCEAMTFPHDHISVDPIPLIVLVCRIVVLPVLSLLALNSCRLALWLSFIQQPRILKRFYVLLAAACGIAFAVLHAITVKNHKEWYVMLPLFGVLSFFWASTHILYIIVCSVIQARLDECKSFTTDGFIDASATPSGLVQLRRILAARGVRYLAVIARPLLWGSVLTTILMHVICWTVRDVYTVSLLCVSLCGELAMVELLHELANTLGGSCIGFGILAPINTNRSDGLVSIVPMDFVEKTAQKATSTLNDMVRFFAHHLITNFGCDYPQSGLDVISLEKKLALFFSQTTSEGPAYDTYVVVYCGPSEPSGNWQLTDGTISLDRILYLWEEAGRKSSSRLIIVADTAHGNQWVREVSRVKEHVYVAFQTSKAAKTFDAGDFVGAFAEANSSGEPETGTVKSVANMLDDITRANLQPVYSVSRRFTDFSFHRPPKVEILRYWQDRLHPCAHGAVRFVINVLSTPCDSIRCGKACLKVAKRWRMKIYPPAAFDTGHGFFLLSK